MPRRITDEQLKNNIYLITHISKEKQTRNNYDIVMYELEFNEYSKHAYQYYIKKLNHEWQRYDHAVQILINTGTNYKIQKRHISYQLYLHAYTQIIGSNTKFAIPPIPEEFQTLELFELYLKILVNRSKSINDYMPVFIPHKFRSHENYLQFININPFAYFNIKDRDFTEHIDIKRLVVTRYPELFKKFKNPELELIALAKKLEVIDREYFDKCKYLSRDQIEFLKLI